MWLKVTPKMQEGKILVQNWTKGYTKNANLGQNVTKGYTKNARRKNSSAKLD